MDCDSLSEVRQGSDSLQYFGDLTTRIHPSWYPVFDEAYQELDDIARRLQEDEERGDTIYPAKEDLFRPFLLTSLDDVKCVIVGQDPYSHGEGNGVAFSAPKKEQPPVSLEVIWAALKEAGYTIPTRCTLEGWCAQGVLLVNKSFTVKKDRPGSYFQRWDGLWYYVAKALNCQKRTIAWCFWGREARELEVRCQSKYKFTTCHPAADRRARQTGAPHTFEGHLHFASVNKILIKHGIEPIRWGQTEPVQS